MIVERFCSIEIILLIRHRFLRERSERLVDWYELFRAQVPRSICAACRIGCFFLSFDTVSQLDRFAAVCRLRMQHADIVGVIAVLHFFPFHWDVQLLLGDRLKAVGLCQRYPDAGLTLDLRQFDSVNELKPIGTFDNARLASSTYSERA